MCWSHGDVLWGAFIPLKCSSPFPLARVLVVKKIGPHVLLLPPRCVLSLSSWCDWGGRAVISQFLGSESQQDREEIVRQCRAVEAAALRTLQEQQMSERNQFQAKVDRERQELTHELRVQAEKRALQDAVRTGAV